MNKRKCDQAKCVFNSKEYGHMCPRCSDCGIEPHMIDEDCVNCWNCLKDEGYVRNGQPDGKQKQDERKMIIINEKVK